MTVGMSLKVNCERKENKKIQSEEELRKHLSECLKDRGCCVELDIFEDIINENVKRIHLIHTPDDGEIIASILKDSMKKKYRERYPQGDLDVHLHSINNSKELWKKLIDVTKKSRNVKIASAGGYKWMTGYAMMFGMINGLDVYYKYEDDDKAKILERLPLSWDIHGLYILAIKNLISSDSGNFIDLEDVSEIRNRNTYREPVLNYITSNELREVLEKTIPIWSNVWIGDLIPETVEHSRNHSRRILDRFSLLVDTGLELKDDLFLALFITASYLHDIGHTVMRVENLRLRDFPEAIREIHHILSTIDIFEKREWYMIDEIARALKINPEKFLKALALVILYHRKKMKINGRIEYDNSSKSLFTKAIIEKFLKKAFGKDFDVEGSFRENIKSVADELREEAIKAVVMLKFLDELDVQADRLVDENYMKARLRRTLDEVEYLLSELENHSEERKIIVKELKKLQIHLESGEIEADLKLSEDFKKLRKSVYESMYKFLMGDEENVYRDLVKIAFKLSQFEHFKKHASIAAVIPVVKDEKVIVKIIPFENREVSNEAISDIRDQINDIMKDFKELFGLEILPDPEINRFGV